MCGNKEKKCSSVLPKTKFLGNADESNFYHIILTLNRKKQMTKQTIFVESLSSKEMFALISHFELVEDDRIVLGVDDVVITSGIVWAYQRKGVLKKRHSLSNDKFQKFAVLEIWSREH